MEKENTLKRILDLAALMDNEAEQYNRVVEFSSNPHRVMNVIFCFVFCLQEANTHSLIEDNIMQF